MRDFLSRVFRRPERDASKVDEPTRVKIECTVATANVAVSPVSGTRSALVRWSLLEERSIHDGREGGVVETRYNVLAVGVFGTETLLFDASGISIEIPLSHARFALIEDSGDGQLLQSIPPELADVVMKLQAPGPIAYREATLGHGDPVLLTATLERVAQTADYRSSAKPGADLRALPDEPILVRDLTR